MMIWRKLLFVPPVALGVLGYVGLMRVGAQDAPPPSADSPTPVQILTLAETDFAATATGFGRVQAERSWQAVSQVSGRVEELAPGLAIGKRVSAGTMLIQVDARDYEIARDKAQGNVTSAQLSLDEQAVEKSNTAALLEIEKRAEELARADYERQVSLNQSGTTTAAALDSAERNLLNQERVVQELENQISLFPTREVSLQTTLQAREIELEEAQRALANTEITAPFEGRVSAKSVAVAQYVRTGDVLLTMEDISTVEILAEFQPTALRSLIEVHAEDQLAALVARAGSPEAVQALQVLGLEAEVVQESGGDVFTWPAEIVRFTGDVDEETGTVAIAMRVEDPMVPDPKTRRPPLAPGAFVEVRLRAKSQPMLLIPRSAVRRDIGTDSTPFIYVLDDQTQLDRAAVTLGPVFDDQYVVEGGAEVGQRVVLTDLNPAILGMQLVARDPDAGDRP